MNFRSLAFMLAALSALVPIGLESQAIDSVKATPSVQTGDSTKTSSASGVDTVVNYSAKDSIVYSMRTRFMNLYGKTDLQYQTLDLKAERTNINWNTMTLVAIGVPDSADTTHTKKIGSPVMKEAGDQYNGSTISYNFQTKKGKINVGETEMEKGYYHGEEIKKDEPEVLYIADGRYTTCDALHPHYYFTSPKMRVIVHDNVVAEPVFFYIADVPVFVLPFGVFPSHGGRSSGFITPAYGEDSRRGRYLSHFGYFWAASDYWDVGSTFDWFTRGGWLNRSSVRYNVRYNFTGSLSANTTSLTTGEPSDPDRTEQHDYNINWTHHQEINPTTRLDVNFTYMTGSYFRNFSNNLDDILRQNVVSTATLTKTWEESNSNFTIYAYRDQSLTTPALSERLPTISFSQGQVFPFKPRTKSRGLSTETSPEIPWYELISLSYSGQGTNNHDRTYQTLKSIADPTKDSTLTNDNFRYGINHSVTVNLSPKLGYFTLTPSFNYNERWYMKHIQTDSNGTRDVNGFRAIRTYNLGLSASTKFFGIVQPGVFGITGIRHTVTPTLSLTYQPDFSDPSHGYFGTYVDKNLRTQKYGFFANEVYGGAPAGKVQSLSMNVGNLFEMKYATADSMQKEDKVQLLNVGASMSYNLAADSLRFSELSLNYRTELGRFLSVSASTSHNFYVFDKNAGLGGARVNRFLFSETGKLADLTFVSLSLNTSLSGQKKQTTPSQTLPSSVQAEQDRVSGGVPPAETSDSRSSYQGMYEREEADFSIPWNISLSYSFSQSQENPSQKIRSSTLSSQLSFNLTEKWQISTGAYYDFVRREFSAPSVGVTRDLHCWTMNLTWRPMGIARGFMFELRVKAPQLQDLKITKQGSARGYYGG